LNAVLALTALADVDVERAVNGLAWDLDLELLGNAGFVQGADIVRANVRRERLIRLVNLIGRGWLSVGLGAIILAGFAPRLARVRSGHA